jgi:hypothetical protein
MSTLRILIQQLSAASMRDPDRSGPASVTLPPIGLEVAVPLAAILLEYPIGYVPKEAYFSHTSRIALDIYNCLISLEPDLDGSTSSQPPAKQHSFLKFSCPAALLDARVIINMLKVHFTPRLQHLGKNTTLMIQHTTETLDRIAL